MFPKDFFLEVKLFGEGGDGDLPLFGFGRGGFEGGWFRFEGGGLGVADAENAIEEGLCFEEACYH